MCFNVQNFVEISLNFRLKHSTVLIKLSYICCFSTYSLQINSLLIYKQSLKRNEVDLQAIRFICF